MPERQRSATAERQKRSRFEQLDYAAQRRIFGRAREFGWSGEIPSVLGTSSADDALESAVDYIIDHNAQVG